MSIPTLILPSQWETTKTTTLVEQVAELGDGYTQYMSVGISPIKIIWQVKSSMLTRNKVNSIVSQLETFAGVTSFSWSPDNGVNIPLAGHFCEEWNVTPYAPNAFMLEATFVRDISSECISLASTINTDLMKTQLAGMVNFFNTYTRSTKPMVANAQGVTSNAFHSVEGRSGYFPSSVGTSEGQALLIDGILKARKYILNPATQTVALNLATLYLNALVTYFYQEAIPVRTDTRLWLPHWLVNSKESFISKGTLAPNFINSGYFNITVSFTNGVGVLSSTTQNGDKLSDVYRVYSVGGKLLWQNVYASLSSGTEYSVKYWVSKYQLVGSQYRVYPSSSSNSGLAPTQTTETPGTIVLNSTYTGNLIVVYATLTGATVGINQALEAYPITRPTQVTPKERNHAMDVSPWLHNAFSEMYYATGDTKWGDAVFSNVRSTLYAAQVVNDNYIFKIDLTTSDAFSYPGTQFITANNSLGATGSRSADGWVTLNVNDGPELYPVAELQNYAVSLQIQQGVTINVSLRCSILSVLEVYLSLSNNLSDTNQIYTFYAPVFANTDTPLTILPEEFVKFTTDNWWHLRIVDSPLYGSVDVTSTLAAVSGTDNIPENGKDLRRLDVTFTMTRAVGGYVALGFVMANVGNMPPAIYYSKSGVAAFLKIVDSLGQTYFWLVPETSGNWSTFNPTWQSAYPNTNPLPGDGTITSLEFVAGVDGVSTMRVWWIGARPITVPFPCVSYKNAIVSRVAVAHTFGVGNFRGNGSPLDVLKGNPGVVPFSANMLQKADGTYGVAAWRGFQPFVGYQDPNMWLDFKYPEYSQKVLDFMSDSQQAYAQQNVNGTYGPFTPAFNWPSWEQGVRGKINQWTFRDTIDPNNSWSGYQHRALVNVAKFWKAKPDNQQAGSIVMAFLNFIDRFYRTTGTSIPPTVYAEFVDPVTTYLSIQDPALIARAALFANLAGGDTAVTFRVFKKSMDFLMSEYVSTGVMAGTFTKSQPTYVENGVTISECFPFQQAECLITLSEIIQYKDKIRYPNCSVNLS